MTSKLNLFQIVLFKASKEAFFLSLAIKRRLNLHRASREKREQIAVEQTFPRFAKKPKKRGFYQRRVFWFWRVPLSQRAPVSAQQREKTKFAPRGCSKRGINPRQLTPALLSDERSIF